MRLAKFSKADGGWFIGSSGMVESFLPRDTPYFDERLFDHYGAYLRHLEKLNQSGLAVVLGSEITEHQEEKWNGWRVTLRILNTDGFLPISECLGRFTPIERLSILKDTLDIGNSIQYDSAASSVYYWLIENLVIGGAGKFYWLPCSPKQFLSPSVVKLPLMGAIKLAWSLFEVDPSIVGGASRATRAKDAIPKEVFDFLVTYPDSVQTGSYEEEVLRSQVASFVFFQAWIYCDAVRIALADNILSLPELDRVRRLSRRLGLTTKQTLALEVVSQMESASYQDFVEAYGQ